MDTPETNACALSVGRLILNFSNIEYSVYLILKEIGGANTWKECMNLEFNKKANRAMDLISKANYPKSDIRSIIRLLNSAIKLAETRNLVAHNPLYFDLYETRNGPNFQLVIPSLRSNKKITHDQIDSASEKIKKCSEDLLIYVTRYT